MALDWVQTGNSDLQPDLDEVLQAEVAPVHEGAPTPVVVIGPVRTQTMPEKAGATKTVTVGITPVKILQADHRRARTTILAIGGTMMFAFNSASKEDSSKMALWPANVAFTHLGDDEIWVMAVAGTITVSVATGRWATGEDGGS